MQLVAAVAAPGTEDVAGEALGMHAHKHVAAVADFALHESDVLLARDVVHEAVNGELAVVGGELGHGLLAHVVVMHAAVVLELLDAHEDDAELLGQGGQLGGAHHRAVLAHDLAAQAALLHAGVAQQVDGGLSVAIALKHAAGTGNERKHVAGPAEILGTGALLHNLAGRVATLGGTDARGGVHMVDGHGEGGLMVVGVVGHHGVKLQACGDLSAHRHADEALGLARHEVDVGLRGILRGANEVALVLAVGVVNHHDAVAHLKLGDCLFNGVHLDVCHGPCPFLKGQISEKDMGSASTAGLPRSGMDIRLSG